MIRTPNQVAVYKNVSHNNEMKVAVVLGTRPEIIKFAPIIKALQEANIEHFVIHTGQHYSESMDKVFWDLFELPEPKYHLHPSQMPQVSANAVTSALAMMINGVTDALEIEKPDWVLVQGDTNSTLAGALAAEKVGSIKIAHVEAGLRSFDKRMPEEINRITVDHASDLLFVPTRQALQHVLDEGISFNRVIVTGNTVEDALVQNIARARNESRVLQDLSIDAKKFGLLTLHRQENTADPVRLRSILMAVFEESARMDLPLVFPAHPRTQNKLEEWKIEIPAHVQMTEPLGYFDFLVLQDAAKLIATDSGGVQEEACVLGTPCITLRENTERPETVELKANILAGIERAGIQAAMREMSEKRLVGWISPYGGGQAAKNIVQALLVHDRALRAPLSSRTSATAYTN